MELAPFLLEEIFEEYEHINGMLVLGASDASPLTTRQLLDLCENKLDDSTCLSYGEVRGEPRLRLAIAESYESSDITTENVLVTIGGSEAIFLAMQALVQPGALVLVCDPVYQPLRSIPEALGAMIETHSYAEADGFKPDVKSLIARLSTSPKPDLLILNTPHNPTGNVISEEALAAILSAAKENQIQVLADEVFVGISHGQARIRSALQLDSSVLVVGSLSKVYGLSGLRVGWLAGPAHLITRCKQSRHYTTIAPPKIVQELATMAVRNCEKILDRTRDIVRKNYSTSRKWLEQHADLFDWVEPQGGLVMLVKFRRVPNTNEFVRKLALEKKVFLIPCSTTFGMPEGYLRLGLGTDPDTLTEGLERLSKFARQQALA